MLYYKERPWAAKRSRKGRMPVKLKKLAVALWSLAAAFCLSGCFFLSVDELYALPKHSDEYNDLQEAIDAAVPAELGYCAPVSGPNQQAIQLVDLDGDGEEEAVVFLKSAGDKPLKAYLFDVIDGHFQHIAVIEGDGSAYESVEYVQLDGKPGLEMVLGRQISDQVLHSLSAYGLYDNRVVELMSANYSSYTTVDLNQGGSTDIVILRPDSEEQSGVAELYRYRDGQMEREPEARMSAGTDAVKRVVTGFLDEGVPAVFVASVLEENSLVTDVFAMKDGAFQNLTGASGDGVQTVGGYYVYATDINSDGLMELPRLELLHSKSADDGGYWLIHWYRLKLDGGTEEQMTTYHNYSAGWYVEIPEAWGSDVTISRKYDAGGMRGYVFSKWRGFDKTPETIFTIYAFSGENRNQLAAENGRFFLGEKGEVAYGASLGTCDWARSLTQEGVMRLFHFVRIDWNSGEK